jgi:hypothetical protein
MEKQRPETSLDAALAIGILLDENQLSKPTLKTNYQNQPKGSAFTALLAEVKPDYFLRAARSAALKK